MVYFRGTGTFAANGGPLQLDLVNNVSHVPFLLHLTADRVLPRYGT